MLISSAILRWLLRKFYRILGQYHRGLAVLFIALQKNQTGEAIFRAMIVGIHPVMKTRVEPLAWRLGCFTGCSGPLAAQTCSFQAVRSLSGFTLSTLLG